MQRFPRQVGRPGREGIPLHTFHNGPQNLCSFLGFTYLRREHEWPLDDQFHL
jgi:hypothetical protein